MAIDRRTVGERRSDVAAQNYRTVGGSVDHAAGPLGIERQLVDGRERGEDRAEQIRSRGRSRVGFDRDARSPLRDLVGHLVARPPDVDPDTGHGGGEPSPTQLALDEDPGQFATPDDDVVRPLDARRDPREHLDHVRARDAERGRHETEPLRR